jgi:hypothetical protein
MLPTTSNPSIVAQLFTAAGIRRLVFVDDRFGITPDRVGAQTNDLTIEVLGQSGAFPTVDFASDNEEIQRNLIGKVIRDATKDALHALFDKLAALQYDYAEGDRDKQAAHYFESVVASSVEILTLSLKQWLNRKAVILSEAAEMPTLFIFDDDFTLEGEGTNYGRQLIGETHVANPGYKFVYALLTHNAPTEDAEITLQEAIAVQSPHLADYLLVIAKSRLADNGGRFAERMKHLLLYRLFRVLTQRLEAETKSASALAIEQIKALGVQGFERIILGTSRAEGAWSPDTLVRVIGVYQQQQIKLNIRKDSELHRLVRDIDPICDVATSVMTEGVAMGARRLQHDEIYETGERINSVHLPIATGDIFKDGKGLQYILLAQPCDLVVRSTGYRRSKDRDSRQLVPLAPLRAVPSKYLDSHLPSEQYELHHFVDNARWSVLLSETYFLPIWLVDLCVLNDDGRCSLIAGQDPSPLLVDPWRKRLGFLHQRAASIAATTDKITDLTIDTNELLHSYFRIPLGSPFEVKRTQVLSEAGPPKWAFEFGLTRVSRLTQLHATAVLIEYAAHLARLAHPHDLTRLKT